MRISERHSWDVTPAEARALQARLAGEVDAQTPLNTWRTVAAADVSCKRFSTRLYAGVVVLDVDSGAVIERVGAAATVPFPYVPGLLSFREAPPLLEAFAQLRTTPDVVLCDGQGIAHPRRFGIASHLGLWLDLPTIGCAKSRLHGTYLEPGPHRGDRVPLRERDETIGTILRTRDHVKPLYISVGHRCDLESAVRVVLALTGRYRLPVPARHAHEFVNVLRREAGAAPGPESS